MHIDLSFFDLDGTLYPESSGLWLAIKQRIDDYLLEKMGFESQEAQQIRQKFLMKYGTTLRGLQLEYRSIQKNTWLLFTIFPLINISSQTLLCGRCSQN